MIVAMDFHGLSEQAIVTAGTINMTDEVVCGDYQNRLIFYSIFLCELNI